MRELYIIAHDMRSNHNVGSLLRTAEGLGVKKVYLTGYTPYPSKKNDSRLPHIARKTDAQIDKTALGASKSVSWVYEADVFKTFAELKQQRIQIVALEQANTAIDLSKFMAPNELAIVLGTEVNGLPDNILTEVDVIVSIPMFGQKESFNVVQAAAMALYQFRFH